MEVSLRIDKIEGITEVSHYELVINDTNQKFHTNVTYKIHTIHDFIFGSVKILVMAKGFLFTKLKGLCVLKNIYFTERQDSIIIPILPASFQGKTDYYTDLTVHQKGKIEISYTVEYVEEDLDYQMVRNSFVHKFVDLFLAPKKSSLIKNLKNLIDEAAKGSPRCKFSILVGVYLLDKYMTNLNHKYTSGLDFEDIEHLNICLVRKTMFPTPITNPDELEGLILRYKYDYEFKSLSEHIKAVNLKNKYKIIKIEKQNVIRGNNNAIEGNNNNAIRGNNNAIEGNNNNAIRGNNNNAIRGNNNAIEGNNNNAIEGNNNAIEGNKKSEGTNYNFNAFLKLIFSKGDLPDQEDGVSSLESLEDPDLEILSEPTALYVNSSLPGSTKRSTQWICKLQKEEEFNHKIHKYLKPENSCPKTIDNLLNNEGFIVGHKIFIEELRNVFYFALGPYGNTWPTTFLERRTKIKPEVVPNPHKRAILETLNIREDHLLVTSFGDADIPDYIIFFDHVEKRLVLSFKGTSTSNETLHDLDCEYTTFYEGLTHKGIKRLAMAFIEKKFEEITLLLKLYDTDDLLITGHSLGGSLASIISIIFQKESLLKTTKITTIAFSSAPIISYKLANQIFPNIFTVNYGNDVIPRLSYGSVIEMKYVCCSLGTTVQFPGTGNELLEKLEEIRTHIDQTQMFPKLYHPGRIYHLRRVKIPKKKKSVSVLLYREVDLEYFENLLVVKHAPKHHMIHHIARVMKECAKDFNELESGMS